MLHNFYTDMNSMKIICIGLYISFFSGRMQLPSKSLLNSTFSYIIKIDGILVGISRYQKEIQDTNLKQVKSENGTFLCLD